MSTCGNVYVERYDEGEEWRDTDDPCLAEAGHAGRHEGKLGARWSDAEGVYPEPKASLALDVEPAGAHFTVRVRCGLPGQRALLGTLTANADDLALLRAAIPEAL